MKKIGVIGAGAWGTALTQNLANAGHDIILWARETEVVESINQRNQNELYLKGVRLNEMIKATHVREDMDDCDIFMLMTPAQHLRSTLEDFKNIIGNKPYIIGSKGIEIESGMLLTDVAEEIIPDGKVGYLSGPTFASEIARGLPCAVTLAMKDKIGGEIVQFIGSRTMRTYLSDDLIGAQLGGAVKNVIAIACGVVEGRQLGESARCALVTRGLAEIGRLAKALGGRKETLMGMSGIGDLMLTSSSMQSRNFSFGYELGKGRLIKDVLAERTAVTEGYHTAKALRVMARTNAVDMPISRAVHDFLTEDIKIDEIFENLLDRPLRKEDI